MPGVIPTGFDRKTLETIISEMETDLLARISPSLNTEAASLIGNLIGVFGSKVSEVWEVMEEVYRAGDRAGASGDALDAIGGLVGVPREPATKSTVTLSLVVGAAFSQAPGALVAYVVGNPTARFVNTETAASVLGGTISVVFEAEETGPVAAPAGALSVIAGAVSGWTSCTNPADATQGTEIESDAAYRARQVSEIANAGSTTVDAIRAAVLQVSGVTSCTVLENDTNATDADGLPPHSFECIVTVTDAVDSNKLTKAIFATKAGGIQAVGLGAEAISVNVTDSQGEIHTIGITRAEDAEIHLSATLDVDLDSFVGEASAKAALVAWGALVLGAGVDVVVSKLSAVLAGLAGVEDVTLIKVDIVGPPVLSANYPIGIRHRALLDTARITLTIVPV
jgi:hypothetical protein